MYSNTDFLSIYATITISFVAFTTITIMLKSSLGKKLLPFQYLLFRFFVEVGLVHVLQAIIPIALIYMLVDIETVWKLSTYAQLIAVTIYLPFHLQRRRRMRAPTPLVSLVVGVGYGIAILLLALTAMEIYWQPSRATMAIYLIWVLGSNMTLFFVVLGTFVEVEPEKPKEANMPSKGKNIAESTQETLSLVKKIVSFFDRVFSSLLPNNAVIAEGNDVLTVVPWSKLINSNIEAILDESESVLKQFDMIPVFGETAKVGPGTMNRKIDWRIYPFIIMHRKIKSSISTPVINDVIQQIPYKVNVWLSFLPPGTNINPHKGTSRAVIRCHIGLHIPKQSDKCFFVVDGHKHVWQTGEMFFFDDTYEHYAVNETDEYRSVLIIDFVRGDLPFFWRWFAYVVMYMLGFHSDARRTLRNYRTALSSLPK